MKKKKTKTLDKAGETPPIESKVEEKKEVQQLTFTEKEVELVIDYLNFIANHASFDGMGVKEVHKFAKLNIEMTKHAKKCQDHIFEHVKTFDRKE